MLRFTSSPRTKSLQACTRLLSTTTPSRQQQQLPVSTPPAYDSILSTEIKPSNVQKSQDTYNSVMKELKHRLRPLEIPVKYHHYVFRPKNITLLRTTTAFAIKDKAGNVIREPEVIRGRPSSKLLMRLIRSSTTAEQVAEATSIFKTYVEHYEEELQSKHVAALLRASAKTGQLYTSMDYVWDTLSKSHPELVDEIVLREMIRLYAIRTASFEGTTKLKGIGALARLWKKCHLHSLKLTELIEKAQKGNTKKLEALKKVKPYAMTEDLQANLLVIYGVAPSFSSIVQQEGEQGKTLMDDFEPALVEAAKFVKPHLMAVNRLLMTEPVIENEQQQQENEEGKKIPFGLRYRYMDITLGVQGLEEFVTKVFGAPLTAGDKKAFSAEDIKRCEESLEKAKALQQQVADLYFNKYGMKFESLAKVVSEIAKGIISSSRIKESKTEEQQQEEESKEE